MLANTLHNSDLPYYVAAAMKVWHSNVYDHYSITLNRIYNRRTQQPERMEFIFTCATHPENHAKPLTHARGKTSDRTTKFRIDVEKCQKAQGIFVPSSSSPSIPYSPETHRALIALRCAKHARPINKILDDDYRAEVNMLRPGTVVPHPTTVQKDLVSIYIHMSTFVVSYFQVCCLIQILK